MLVFMLVSTTSQLRQYCKSFADESLIHVNGDSLFVLTPVNGSNAEVYLYINMFVLQMLSNFMKNILIYLMHVWELL